MRFGLVAPLLLFLAQLAQATDLPPVPYLANDEERRYVGIRYYAHGEEVHPSAEIPDEVVCRLYVYLDPEVRVDAGVVPHIVEVRRYVPGLPPEAMPILRILWDANRDGLADYVAVAEHAGGRLTFRVYPISSRRLPMAKQWDFDLASLGLTDL